MLQDGAALWPWVMVGLATSKIRCFCFSSLPYYFLSQNRWRSLVSGLAKRRPDGFFASDRSLSWTTRS